LLFRKAATLHALVLVLGQSELQPGLSPRGNVRTIGYTGIKNFILAKNTSQPNGISHSKFLMLLSLLGNADIAPTVVGNLKKVHAIALSDGYYSTL
jgi:hypothetical protein